METIEYKDYLIEIVQDEGADNPFEAWDCEPPLLAANGRDTWSYGGIGFEPPTLTREQILKSSKALLDVIGFDSWLQLARVESWHYMYGSGFGDIVDLINDYFYSYVDNKTNNTDKLDALEEVYTAIGIIALAGCATGYSQGDYTDILVVATPEWQKTVGASITEPSQLQSAIDLYAAWAFGDVYGYIAKDKQGNEIDSCFGFYGRDYEKSGLLEDARASIDYEIEKLRKSKIQKTKAMIRHHVPLNAR